MFHLPDAFIKSNNDGRDMHTCARATRQKHLSIYIPLWIYIYIYIYIYINYHKHAINEAIFIINYIKYNKRRLKKIVTAQKYYLFSLNL